MDETDDWAEDEALSSKNQQKSTWNDEDVVEKENQVKETWEDDEHENENTQVVKASEKKGIVADVSRDDSICQQSINTEAVCGSTSVLITNAEKKSLDNFIPNSETDFLEYAELISHKLRLYEHRYFYLDLLKAVMRFSMISIKAADVKEIASSAAAVANEKIKAESEAHGHKWKTAATKKESKKKKVYVEKPEDVALLDAYNALDDDHFM